MSISTIPVSLNGHVPDVLTLLLESDDAFFCDQLPTYLKTDDCGPHIDILYRAEVLARVLALDDAWFIYFILTVAGPEYGDLEVLFDERILPRIARIPDPLFLGKFLPQARRLPNFYERDMHFALRPWKGQSPQQRSSALTLEPPETLTALLAADIPPPVQLFDGLMHEGMLLFGGKSKRGKSWLMFDLAIALAVGRAAFTHFDCQQKRPVLYLALEDGRARLQGRARAIQPNLTTVDAFHLRYNFPALTEGGIELLAEEIARYHYGLVVIDVLAKLEKPKPGKSDKNYHDIYEMFTPLQDLRKQHPFCLAMLTHLRKQEADDVFDSLLGSVAYQGAQDVLWVLERKPKDDFAFLHIRDKDAEDKTIALRFLDGHWEYIGEGDEYEVSRDQRKVLKILAEENREMGIEEIRKAGEWPEHKYGYVRKLLITMVKDDLIHHSSYGKYSATVRAMKEIAVDERELDERGDRIPF